MSIKQGSTLTAPPEQRVQVGIRIPPELSKTVSHEAIDRGVTETQLWIDAMRAFLKIKA